MRRLLLALPLLATACGDPEPTTTSGLSTDELSLQVLTDGDESGTDVTVGIYAKGYTYARLALADGDKLFLRVEGSAPIPLERSEGSGSATYSARFGLLEGEFSIDLERGGQPIRTKVTLPPSFAIDPPKDGLHLDRAFTVTWSPAVATASVKATISSDCVRVGERALAHDTGSFTWSAADYVAGAEAPPCTATIKLSRNGGSIRIAPELAGVQLFRAEHHRAIGVLASRP